MRIIMYGLQWHSGGLQFFYFRQRESADNAKQLTNYIVRILSEIY